MPDSSSSSSGTVRKRKGKGKNPSTDHGTVGANAIPRAGPTEAQPRNHFSREELWKNAKHAIMRAFFMYMALRYVMYQQKQDTAKPADGGTEKRAAGSIMTPAATPKVVLDRITRSNLWKSDTRYDVRVFQSLSSSMSYSQSYELSPVFLELDFDYSLEQRNYRSANATMEVPETVSMHNSSWYAHVFITKSGEWGKKEIHPTHLLQTTYDLISWNKGPIVEEGTSLLGGSNETEVEKVKTPSNKDEIFQYIKPMMTIGLVTDYAAYDFNVIPPTIQHLYRAADKVAGFPTYYPPVFINDFWLLTDTLKPMNDTVKESTIEVYMEPISMKKWAMIAQFEATMKMQMQYGASNPKEADKLKRMLFETNPILLGTTVAVSLAHSILEMLAFRNDISHWRSIKSMEGISVRSMSVKIFMEIVIFLYLFDNDTSWMIIIGNAVGIAIEIWKLCKAVEFKNFGKKKLLGFIPWFETKDKDSYSKETKKYDDEAMRYLSYLAYPLVFAYSIYSLVYEKHKSWYSWIIGSAVGAVYAFGFLLMIPAVYINYKLKSVAHLPMRALTYKALNTIIDDLFSFVIKMPMMHRIACFRDDVIFLVFLYQCYIYPVDKSRVNEFGQTFDEDGNEIIRQPEDSKKKKKKSAAKQKTRTSPSSESKDESENTETENSVTSVVTEDNAQEEISSAASEERVEKDAESKKTE